MGKGSAPRPYSVDSDTFESNWDKIFRKKKIVMMYHRTLMNMSLINPQVT